MVFPFLFFDIMECNLLISAVILLSTSQPADGGDGHIIIDFFPAEKLSCMTMIIVTSLVKTYSDNFPCVLGNLCLSCLTPIRM